MPYSSTTSSRASTGRTSLLHLPAIATAITLVLAVAILISACAAGEPPPAETGAVTVIEPEVSVHVAGAVNVPGLYTVAAGARVADVITAAGGAAEGAALDEINLARPLQDGEQVFVPIAGAEPAGDARAPTGGSDTVAGSAGPGNSASGLVNLNRAAQEQLETLPGVGPVTAQRIIESRTTDGPFRSVDDLTRVSGIGQKTLERIRAHATV